MRMVGEDWTFYFVLLLLLMAMEIYGLSSECGSVTRVLHLGKDRCVFLGFCKSYVIGLIAHFLYFLVSV